MWLQVRSVQKHSKYGKPGRPDRSLIALEGLRRWNGWTGTLASVTVMQLDFLKILDVHLDFQDEKKKKEVHCFEIYILNSQNIGVVQC